MYEKYWQLNEKPFKNNLDTRFFYCSSQHEEVLTKMVYAVEEDLGAGLLTGVFGCGKTIIGQMVCEKLISDKYKVAFINMPQLDYVDFLRSIVRSLKAVELPIKKTELSADSLLEILGNILQNNIRDGKDTVVVIDEAHIIQSESIWEGLRLLMNFQNREKFLLTLLLLGQSELRQRIEDNKQLAQRIGIKCHLEAFKQQDTKNYIMHRLRIAAGKEDIFDDEAIDLIYKQSGGIPRKINRICDFSLLLGMHMESKFINTLIVKESLKNLGGT